MRLSLMVMAHTSRQAEASELAQRLGARISMDDGSRGETANGDRAWAAHDPGSDWALTLQDDALPIDGFLGHALAALAHAPPTAVSFYVGTGRPMQPRVARAATKADKSGAAWLSCYQLLWGVAVAMPTHHIDHFLAWAKDRTEPYDTRVGAYWHEQGVPIRYTWPSLVDHADGPTLLAHPWGPPKAARKAWRLGAADTWDTNVVPI
jgi:hypothetical protein